MQMQNHFLDFSIVDTPARIDAQWVLSRVSDQQIFYNYFGEFVPYKKTYNSIFRKDRTPSTGFYFAQSGKLKYKDLGTGESWDCFAFVAQLYGISYFQAIKKVACDFGLTKCESAPLEKKVINKSFNFDKKAKEDTIIEVSGSWTLAHKEYWEQYGITKEELERENVFPAQSVKINEQYIPNNPLRFAYKIKVNEKIYYKIYTPNAKNFKWVSNIPLHIPFGYNTLSFLSSTIFITKSVKDMIVLKKIFPSVIATQNESEAALNAGMVKFLCDKFKERIIIFDNDDVGVEACKKFNSKGFGYFNIPKSFLEEGIKDVSDLVRVYGLENLKQLFKQKNLL